MKFVRRARAAGRLQLGAQQHDRRLCGDEQDQRIRQVMRADHAVPRPPGQLAQIRRDVRRTRPRTGRVGRPASGSESWRCASVMAAASVSYGGNTALSFVIRSTSSILGDTAHTLSVPVPCFARTRYRTRRSPRPLLSMKSTPPRWRTRWRLRGISVSGALLQRVRFLAAGDSPATRDHRGVTDATIGQRAATGLRHSGFAFQHADLNQHPGEVVDPLFVDDERRPSTCETMTIGSRKGFARGRQAHEAAGVRAAHFADPDGAVAVDHQRLPVNVTSGNAANPGARDASSTAFTPAHVPPAVGLSTTASSA